MLHCHYNNFVTTTNCSAPVPCIDTLILMAFYHLSSSLNIKTTGSRSSMKSPDQNHPTYTPDTTCTTSRAIYKLLIRQGKPSVLMSNFKITTLRQWFSFIRLSDLYLKHFKSNFSLMLLTIALDNSYLRWFVALFWHTTAVDLPPSLGASYV